MFIQAVTFTNCILRRKRYFYFERDFWNLLLIIYQNNYTACYSSYALGDSTNLATNSQRTSSVRISRSRDIIGGGGRCHTLSHRQNIKLLCYLGRPTKGKSFFGSFSLVLQWKAVNLSPPFPDAISRRWTRELIQNWDTVTTDIPIGYGDPEK